MCEDNYDPPTTQWKKPNKLKLKLKRVFSHPGGSKERQKREIKGTGQAKGFAVPMGIVGLANMA